MTVSDFAIGQAASGRWWVQCTRPGCDHRTSSLQTEDAARAVAVIHQTHHRRGPIRREEER